MLVFFSLVGLSEISFFILSVLSFSVSDLERFSFLLVVLFKSFSSIFTSFFFDFFLFSLLSFFFELAASIFSFSERKLITILNQTTKYTFLDP